ncbi:MAG: YegS/Rv2252/BmrU family lipid kinase [Lachnospiraceae bacterium]|jgi:diacylglycerol kinase (ATP)|nr:YegS/Rv2252/BmrU family lipid kinase [Lachnospiraceae bacterium]
MHHYFILNPAAGQGRALDYIPLIHQCFSDSPAPYTIYTSTGVGDITAYVRKTATESQEELRFYACGGDGTLNEVICGAIGHPHVSVGILPAGTGNDFIRSFQNAEFFRQVPAQVAGSPILIDLIRINEQYAVNMVNIGFDCNAALAASQLKKKPLLKGPLAYAAGALQQFCHKMGSALQFELDGKETFCGDFLLCTIANGRFCGGGFHSSPQARPDDGLLDLAAVRLLSRLRFISLLPSYRSGSYLIPQMQTGLVTYRQCRQLSLSSTTPLYVCIDGEISSFTSLHIEICPQAMRFILPYGSLLGSR